MVKGTYDRLEGSYKIAKIKKLERWSYVLQTIGIIAIFILLSFVGGAQLKPFYFPVFWPMLVAFTWILVVNIETYAFRLMEINRRDSESAKFLMADRSMKKAYTIIIVAAIFFAVIVTPHVTDQIENNIEIDGEKRIEGMGEVKRDTVEFVSRGRFDLSMPDKIKVGVKEEAFEDGSSITVGLISKDDYENGRMAYMLAEKSLNINTVMEGDPITLDMPEMNFESYYILITSDENATIEYTITKTIPGEKMYSFSTIALGFVVTNLIGAYLMYPIKKKHSEQAIYK